MCTKRPEQTADNRSPRRGLLFFFFQAEDGIRDLTVTGVQTCALPILSEGGFAIRSIGDRLPEGVLSVSFQLPSLEGDKVRGRAVVVWAGDFFTGLDRKSVV